MGPILSITFGISVIKEPIISRGMRNEVVGVVIGVIVGMVCGFVLYAISGTDFVPGDEILNRGRGEVPPASLCLIESTCRHAVLIDMPCMQ